jgi:hypothetical protein
MIANSRVLAARTSHITRATLALFALAASACPGFTPHPSTEPDDAGETADGSADAPSDGAAATSDATANACDPSTDPTTAACLTPDDGLFVSSSGSDTEGDGSPAHPFATVGHALHAPNSAERIYICGGQYTERVALAAGATANLYGGFSCPELGAGEDADGDAGGAAADASSTEAGAGWAPGGPPTVFLRRRTTRRTTGGCLRSTASRA